MFKKFAVFLLVVFVAFSLFLPTVALAESTDKADPGAQMRWTYIHTVYNWMGINDSGKATMVDLIPQNFVNRNVSHNMIKYRK